MGEFTIEYETHIVPAMEEAISSALKNEVKEAALDALKESGNKRIYQAYTPKFWSRRGSFRSDWGYDTSVTGTTLTITATAPLQNLYGDSHSEDLGDIIAEGWENFNMPFERPWMDEGIDEHLAELEDALAVGMKRQGF